MQSRSSRGKVGVVLLTMAGHRWRYWMAGWSICLIFLLSFFVLMRAGWRIAAAWWRGRSSLFRFSLMLLHFPHINKDLLFLLDAWRRGGRGRTWWRWSTSSSTLSKSDKLYLSLLRSGQSFFLKIYTNVPMTLPPAEPALVVGLRTLRFLWLASNLDPNSLFIDILAVHLINSLMDGFLWVKHLNLLGSTMKA